MSFMPATTRVFDSVEEIDEFNRDLGWEVEYRQIEAGSFTSTFTELEGETWFLMEEQSNRRVEAVADAPDGMFMLGLTEGEPGIANGQAIGHDQILIQTSDANLQATIPAGTRAVQIGFQAEQARETINAVAPDLVAPDGQVRCFDVAPAGAALLRQSMGAALAMPARRQATRDETALNILAEIVKAASDRITASPGRKLHRVANQRALDRAREYIDAHLTEVIRIPDICRYSGAQLRSLERVFAKDLGVTPQQYIKARRLNAVRRCLVASERDEGLSVTQLAQDHGFSHLGRFAGDYASYFGESPSRTLQTR